MSKGLSANEWVGHVSSLLGGKGGGKAESAQASGPNISALNEAIKKAKDFAQSKLGGSVKPSGKTLHALANHYRTYKCLIAAQYSNTKINLQPASDKIAGPLPELEDGDLRLIDSNAVAWYLSNNQLKGNSQEEKSQILQWLTYSESELAPAISNWVLPVLGVDLKVKNVKEVIKRAKDDLKFLLSKLNETLLTKTYLVGERISLADIAVACVLLPLYREVLDGNNRKSYVNVNRWFQTIVNQPNVKAVIGEVKLCTKERVYEEKSASTGKQAKERKVSEAKEETVKEDLDASELALAEEPKSKDPFAGAPKSSFDMEDFKRFYSNNSETESIPYLWQKIDLDNWSIWFAEYKYPEELKQIFMSCNLITGMFQRLDKMRKHAFASVCLFGENNNSTISGIWIWRGQDLIFEKSPDWQVDYESYTWTKLNPTDPKTKELVKQYLSWEGADKNGKKFNQGKIFK